MGQATQDLRIEHDSILHVLHITDQMIAAESKDTTAKLKFGNELVYFLKIFADKCHHGKEENYLFAELVKAGLPNEGGPVGVMLSEHQLGRQAIALMEKSLATDDWAEFTSAAAQYIDLLRDHIGKENNVLFVMADEILDEAKQGELFEKFTQHEQSVIGHGVHEQLQAMIHQWAEELAVQRCQRLAVPYNLSGNCRIKQPG